jgi:hypothetical protein
LIRNDINKITSFESFPKITGAASMLLAPFCWSSRYTWQNIMFTLPFPLSAAPEMPRDKASEQDPYASEAQTKALLRFGAQYRLQRIQAADMITTDEAAALSGTTRMTMNAWIKSGRCIGVSHLRRGFKLPRWQFEPFIFPVLAPMAAALGSTDGWQLLAFLESPHPALDGQSPRTALEQGTPAQRVINLATAEGH